MKSKYVRRILIAALLALPLAAGAHGTHKHESLKAQAAALPGGSVYNVGSQWIDSNGKKFDIRSLSGNPRVIAMLYTSCTTACPMLIGEMKALTSQLDEKAKATLRFTVFSFDPSRDTPQAMKSFAEKLKLDEKTWTLLAPATLASATELAAALGVRFKKLEDGEYIHSNILFLLNEKGEIVASKEGLNKPSADFVAKIRSLLAKSL